MENKFKGDKILLTGATGSFGKRYIKNLLKTNPNIERLVIFSRDELKQYELSQVFNESKYPGIRYFLGDIRDKERFKQAIVDIDVVIHAAALKQVPAAEYNPFEFIKTNILGSQNVVECCLESPSVKDIVALSTDKASAPVNLYGATKLCADKIFVSANYISGKSNKKFSVVRYGNVIASRGSVIPFFRSLTKNQTVPITHPKMTRFSISLNEGVELVNYALNNAKGGEIFIPKIPSYRITDVAEAICPGQKIKITGIRPGEKIHESMITESESLDTWETKDKYIIMPSGPVKWNKENYLKSLNANKVKEGFEYSSGKNEEFLSVNKLREIINKEEKID